PVGLLAGADHEAREHPEIDSAHHEHGYRRVRKLLSEQYNRDNLLPDVQIVGYDHAGDRSLRVQHRRHRGRNLSGESARGMRNLQKLWGFTVWLETVEEDGTLVDTTEFPA